MESNDGDANLESNQHQSNSARRTLLQNLILSKNIPPLLNTVRRRQDIRSTDRDGRHCGDLWFKCKAKVTLLDARNQGQIKSKLCQGVEYVRKCLWIINEHYIYCSRIDITAYFEIQAKNREDHKKWLEVKPKRWNFVLNDNSNLD